MRPQLRSEESRTPKVFKRFKDPVDAGVRIDEDAVPSAHRRWAPGYVDTVVAMYVMTVVPDPEKVMRELSRVCCPGGEVIIVNHFSAEEGMRGWVERRMAPFADMLGWRPVFDIERVLVCEDLTLMEKRG